MPVQCILMEQSVSTLNLCSVLLFVCHFRNVSTLSHDIIPLVVA